MSTLTVRSLFAASALLLLVSAARSQPTVLYVDRDATGAGNGTSWTDAFTGLQPALDAARVRAELHGWYTLVWVAEGTYAPAGPDGPRTATFAPYAQVGVYGGFAGNETAFSQRDPAAHPTILTGDLQGDDQPNGVNHQNNAYQVVSVEGLWPSTVFDGLIIRGGYADDEAGGHGSGAGLHALTGSPTLVGCTFTDNYSKYGGAVAAGNQYWGFLSSIRDCTFTDNVAQPGRGGAIYVAGVAQLELDGCTFIGNRATGYALSTDGGAIFIEEGARVSLRHCQFLGNSTSTLSTELTTGGAICNLSGQLALDSCVFAGNASDRGGALWNGGDITVSDCLFSGNTAQLGGGMFTGSSSVTLQGCTFSGNAAVDGGGLVNDAGTLAVHDCVLWGNFAPDQPLVRAQWRDLAGATSLLRWSLVQGLFDTIPGENPPNPADFPGCLAVDPLFVDALGTDGVAGTADDDLSLAAGSPARDAGRNDLVPVGLAADLVGATRFHDDPLAPDVGSGTPPLVDMGAMEGGAPVVWTVLGGGTPHGEGPAMLRGSGSLLPGSAGALELTHMMPGTGSLLFVSIGIGSVPFKGGLLVAFPPQILAYYWFDWESETLPWTDWPAGASGATLVFQFALGEPSAYTGLSLSNGLAATVP